MASIVYLCALIPRSSAVSRWSTQLIRLDVQRHIDSAELPYVHGTCTLHDLRIGRRAIRLCTGGLLRKVVENQCTMQMTMRRRSAPIA